MMGPAGAACRDGGRVAWVGSATFRPPLGSRGCRQTARQVVRRPWQDVAAFGQSLTTASACLSLIFARLQGLLMLGDDLIPSLPPCRRVCLALSSGME
jgi:hypothetical protein